MLDGQVSGLELITLTCFSDLYRVPFATPATAEKGYLDVKMTVATADDHSSMLVSIRELTGLIRAIYRFTGTPSTLEMAPYGHHTVNEKAKLSSQLHTQKWLHALIQKPDRYDGPE